MPSVQLNTPAPDFTLTDYQGNQVQLSQYRGKSSVILVLNRGFL